MRHLKKFSENKSEFYQSIKNFNENSHSEIPYEMISDYTYDKFTSGYCPDYTEEDFTIDDDKNFTKNNWDNFTTNEFKQLESIFNNHFDSENKHISIKLNTMKGRPNGRVDINYGINLEFIIIKLKYEWFYLYHEDDETYYKCDQIDGLLRCINEVYLNSNEDVW